MDTRLDVQPGAGSMPDLLENRRLRKHRLYTAGLCLWALMAALAPEVPQFRVQGMRPEDLLALVLAAALAVGLDGRRTQGRGNPAPRIMLAVAAAFTAIAAAAVLVHSSLISYGGDGQGQAGLQGVVKEFVRFAKYAFIALLFGRPAHRRYPSLLVAALVSCWVLFGVQVCQYENVPNVNDWIAQHYTGGETTFLETSEMWAVSSGEFRSGSLMAILTVFGAFASLPFGLAPLSWEPWHMTLSALKC